MAQVVEYLLCKCEALSSNSSTTKKKEKKVNCTIGSVWLSLTPPLPRLGCSKILSSLV
jgi:hypothetical protein